MTSHALQRLAVVEDRIRGRLRDLSARLGSADWLDGAFSAADLLMVMVLRRLNRSTLLHEFPNLLAYVAPGRSTAGFQTGFRGPAAVFTAASAG